ncbi:hypothetical protein [Cytobacillus sp. BC1816]
MMEMDASLEWFGPNVKDILTKDSNEIMRVFESEKALYQTEKSQSNV